MGFNSGFKGLTKLGKKTKWISFIYLIMLFSCASCIALNEIWKLGELINYRKLLLPFEVMLCFVCWNNWWIALQIILSTILTVKWIFCSQNSSTERYQYTSKAAVFKLSLLVYWHFMLLMCCRLQKLGVHFCNNMTDGGLLEGIGSLQELTSLRLTAGHNLTAQALSKFLHRPSMTSIVLLDLSHCTNLDDKWLKGIADRCNKLTYLHF